MSLIKEIAYRGHDTSKTTILLTPEILAIEKLLNELSSSIDKLKPQRLKEIKTQAFTFYNRHYKLHDIPFILEKRIGPFRIEFSGLTNPFTIPVIKEKNIDPFYGKLNEVITFNSKTTLAYRSISLSKNLTDLSYLAYIHEITHTALTHQIGLVKYYYNSEILSIFNETLAAYEKEDNEQLLHLHDKRRLIELKESIATIKNSKTSKEDLIEASCYCYSVLKAYYLFYMYYYGDQLTKDSIINIIQNTFDGTNTLEDNLTTLGITDSTIINVKSLKKYLYR